MKILVIGAHPDDEVLGLGGAICKHVAEGDKVYVCIVTKAYEPKWSKDYIETKEIEQKEVDNYLCIKKRYNLNLPTVRLNTIPHGEFNKKISDVVKKINPNVLYTHYKNDLNSDHSIIYKASLVATRPPKNIKLLCYETLSVTDWSDTAFKPNIYYNIKDFIEKKIDAFKIYKSEVKQFPHPRSPEGIRILAQKRGSEVYLKYAEAFILIREILM